ncbi:MAG: metallophosphoesterase [Candidatus Sericytochromatia bacterium]|nr:metallophosphoesterase [Candidatus Sericytochromatia bacterium]
MPAATLFRLFLPLPLMVSLVAACTVVGPSAGQARPQAASPFTSARVAEGPSTFFTGAGDIAYSGPGAEQTARLLDAIPGAIFTLGDNAYQSGSSEEFASYYHPTWGRHLNRTFPVIGNHEYRTPGAAGYFGYFGPRAGDARKGYYAFNLDAHWRVYALNSATESDAASKQLGPDSAQYRWLAEDLDAHRDRHVIAMWHHPRYSSGAHGDNPETDALWRLLVSKGADIALWGHDHHYERFHPMDAEGKRDDKQGLSAFVVGTGGKNHYIFFKLPKRTTAVRNASTFGVLKFTLRASDFDWEFVPVAGETFRDRGRSPVR